MKPDAGWTALVMVAVATTIGVGSYSGKPAAATAGTEHTPVSSAATPNTAGKKPSLQGGPCQDLAGHLATFLNVQSEVISGPLDCYPKRTGDTSSKASTATKEVAAVTAHTSSLHIILATTPDPLHTRFSLNFDRLTAAIQQAASDDQYVYDSSWLPWETEETTYARLEDRDVVELRTEAREAQPGLLLFRHKLPPESPLSSTVTRPYVDGLLVFIVGEEPTGGIHREQFYNAVQWASLLQPNPAATLSILGPNFSGSIPSLATLLESEPMLSYLQTRSWSTIPIFSGSVTSSGAVKWLLSQAKTGPLSATKKDFHLDFHSFQQDDNVALEAYCGYLKNTTGSEASLGRLAVISEDETAYGTDAQPADNITSDPEACKPSASADGPTLLYYPRDISALRTAYQQQSLFSRSTQASSDTARRTLRSDLADPAGKDHDTIRAYSGNQTVLDQEAELQQLVAILRAHRSQYLVLRSSNPLDQLFLTQFFRMTYPEGRIVINSADLLLRREVSSGGLTGIMTLTTYPLLPWQQDLTDNRTPRTHIHRVFTHEGAEGTYVALRFLLNKPSLVGESAFLPLNHENAAGTQSSGQPKFDLPDYRLPLWWHGSESLPGACCRPPTWLSVLGRDGFWPVAAFPTQGTAQIAPSKPPPPLKSKRLASFGRRFAYVLGFGTSHLLNAQVPGTESSTSNKAELPGFGMPLSMVICLLLLTGWALFHASCCAFASLTVSPSHRAHFVPSGERQHSVLVLFGSLLIAAVPIMLAWSFGELALAGDPLPHPVMARVLLPVLWLLAGAAAILNVWHEHRLQHPAPQLASQPAPQLASQPALQPALQQTLPKLAREVCRICWPALTIYVGVSLLFILLLEHIFEAGFTESNRVPTYLRAMNLTTGVSPMVSLMILAIGLYLWFWYSLQSLSLLSKDRPRLPSCSSLCLQTNDSHDDFPPVLSQEGMADPLENFSSPLSPSVCRMAAFFLIATLLLCKTLFGEFSLRSLGTTRYSDFFAFCLTVCISILFANAWQLVRVWLRLRPLLVFLDKLPLRRTMLALRDCSWGSLWNMGSSMHDVRYKIVSRELESLTHLHNDPVALQLARNTGLKVLSSTTEHANWMALIDKARYVHSQFAKQYARHWDNPSVRGDLDLGQVQKQFAKIAGVLLLQTLIPAWRQERQSLVLDTTPYGKTDAAEEKATASPEFIHLQNAEELVCLIYLGFIQNVLGSMRSIALSMMWLFIAIAIAVSSYPFDPRPVLSATILIVFFGLGAVIVLVYSQMHRDATLSHLTNTKPGELGSGFWLKLVGFGVGPLLGLLASVFPEFGSFLFSWVQPGLSSIK